MFTESDKEPLKVKMIEDRLQRQGEAQKEIQSQNERQYEFERWQRLDRLGKSTRMQ